MTNSTKERHERACFYFQYTVNDIFHQIVSQQGLANHGPTSWAALDSSEMGDFMFLLLPLILFLFFKPIVMYIRPRILMTGGLHSMLLSF